MTGRVKWYSDKRGYGFIAADSGTDYFFHVYDVINQHSHNEGDRVRFELKETSRGLKAVRVEPESI